MTTPVFVGMPTVERTFAVPKAAVGFWPGRIICGGPCEDGYRRIVIYDQGGGRYLKLQRSALASIHDVEDRVGFQVHVTGHGWRSCADQLALYRSDPRRYAPPNVTAHPRGLAIDLDSRQGASRLAKLHAALTAAGWHQARPVDDPLHYSFGIEV